MVTKRIDLGKDEQLYILQQRIQGLEQTVMRLSIELQNAVPNATNKGVAIKEEEEDTSGLVEELKCLKNENALLVKEVSKLQGDLRTTSVELNSVKANPPEQKVAFTLTKAFMTDSNVLVCETEDGESLKLTITYEIARRIFNLVKRTGTSNSREQKESTTP